jgi:hypothetical protein
VRKNARDAKNGQLAARTMIFLAAGQCRFAFSVKVFLSDDENKIQIFSCRF